MVVQERHLWLNLVEMKDIDKAHFLDAPISQAGLFGDSFEGFAQQFSAVQQQTEAIQHTFPGVMHHPPLPPGPGFSLPFAVAALLCPPELLCPRPNRYLGRCVEPLAGERHPPRPSQAPSHPGSWRSFPDAGKPEMLEFSLSQEMARTVPLLPLLPHSRPRPILPVAKRVRFGDDIPPHAPLASPVWDPGSSVRMPQNAPPSVPSTPTPFRCTTTGMSIVPLEPLAQRLEAWLMLPSLSRWLTCTIRFGYAIQFARRPPKFNGVLETSVAVRNAPVLREEIAVLLAKDAIEPVPPAERRQAFCSPYFIVPKKRGGLRPILDLRVLNRALHKLPFKMRKRRRIIKCIQPQDWFAAIDLKDAYFHVSILLRHRPFLRFAFIGRAWQYRVLPFGLSLSPRVFTKVVEGALTPWREVGVRILNYLDDWLILAQSREQLGDPRDLVLRHLKQFQRLLGHMASAAAVTPLGLLHMRPLQHWLHSRVPRWAVHLALRQFRPLLLGKHVLVRTDNTAAVSYINRLGGIRSHSMSQLARHLLLWSHTHFKSLRAVHISGQFNCAAEALLWQLSFPGEWRHHPESRSMEPPCVAPGRDAADLSGLPPAVVETIIQARAPSTRQTYALKWSLFATWCSSRREDPRRCTIGVVLFFLQERLERRLSPSTFKVYVAAITAHHDAVDGRSLGKHDLIVRFLKGARRMNPSRPPLVPSWDLSIVLAGLQRGPFEPLDSVELKFLSLKTALLTALTSIKRVGDLQAFSVSEECLVFGPV